MLTIVADLVLNVMTSMTGKCDAGRLKLLMQVPQQRKAGQH